MTCLWNWTPKSSSVFESYFSNCWVNFQSSNFSCTVEYVMLKVVEAYLISYLISSLSTLLSATTWTNHQSPEVIHSSWILHVVVVPRNLGYRKPKLLVTTCALCCTCLNTRQRDLPWREITIEQLPFLPSMLWFRFWDAPVLFS